MRTLAVVGGGAVGLAVAWQAAEAGWTVTVFDPAPGSGASFVAGGMLAPLSEGWPGEDRVLGFGAAALAAWPGFAERLRAVTGESVFVADETLTVALDGADAADLRTVADWLAGFGHDLRVLDRAGVRALEPALARTVRAGLLASAEPAVDNRRVLRGLQAACVAAGVRVRAETVVSLDDLPHDRVVLAAGAHSAELWPGLPVRPVKGEILRLRHRPGVRPAPTRVIRARVHGRQVYLVPRADGIVVGATQYEAGFDTTVTVGGVRDLIADAEAVLPGIEEYELAEASAGARPGTPDNLPLLGPLDDRVVAATGHGRNGMLTLALTATLVPGLLDGESPEEARVASPQRFPALQLSPGGVR
ncbi:glycine oxidase ThiO [Nocardia asteroides NBRC 15531]|uniref:glycine oxidase n=1 Tax=Nocardia asteroides NBRC 15531 TaxID=1110697 RepID=U5E411_NOCAS|nr:glycine oxidase ThiO [Nocardia asteroides]TLF69428.1 glycine oxidase ThiO [Nocardia asteroides NBRC 15531]UGT48927.1 glycine oxidase ThiO [Nocardia asteroides]SFL74909.1 glycine oxidase [Nocardia asteroides]VEG31305.1 Glycine oxidase [Nocardia asteroides]GAD83472.1 thiamine biosynthesis oxidoreductase ThiO [Nocardia asteroides NBRC 15531]